MKGLVRAIGRRLGLVSYLTPAQETLLRRALAASGGRLNNTAAPGLRPGAADANGWKEPKDMTTIIRRRAHDVHAGDVIVQDPDHPDRVVRWRAQQPARRNADGVTLIECRDLADGRSVLAVFPSMAEVAVEPAGVA